MSTKINRREFLKVSAMVAAASAVSACTPAPVPTVVPTTPPAAPPAAPTVGISSAPAAAATSAPAASMEYREAPMLAELVKSGKLPAVGQRLPQKPRVIKPLEEVGKYSSVWHRAYLGVSDRTGPAKLVEEFLIEWDAPDPNTVKVVANAVEKWEQSADATEFTFYLRKGLKWSDGVEVTTDDVKFWWEDFQNNKDLMPAPGHLIRQKIGGENKDATLTIVDKYTWKVKYAAPFPLLPMNIATIGSGTDTTNPGYILPSHYLKKFLPKNTPVDELNKLATDRKLTNWQALWGAGGNLRGPIADWFLNPDLPVIYPWKAKSPAPADPMTMERNPYYFQVDSAGNQLPYFDEVDHALYSSQEVLNLWIASGKIDMQMRNLSTGDYTFYKENETKGKYRTFKWRTASTDTVYFYWDCPNRELAKLFEMPEFRQALNIAINREEIVDLVWDGLGKPMQASPIKGSPYYDAEFSAKWAEYDPKTANELLDKIGLKKGANGIRVKPDGSPLEITLDHIYATGTPEDDMFQLISKYWAAIGVKCNLKYVERSLNDARGDNLEQELSFWAFSNNTVPIVSPWHYIAGMYEGYYRGYINDARKHSEPPADHPIRKVWDTFDKCRVEPDEVKRNALFKEVLAWHKQAPQWIGLVGEKVQPMIVANDFRNVLDGYIYDNTLRDSGIQNPQQFFRK